MKYFHKIIAAVIMLSILFFGGIIYYTVSWLKRPHPTEEVVAGKEIWQQQACNQCHTVLDTADYLASDLTHVITIRSADWVRDFLQSSGGLPVSSTGDLAHASVQHPELAMEQIESLISFLTYVDRFHSREHPPQPNNKKPTWY